jgi:outer membrane protein assembly factor BamB
MTLFLTTMLAASAWAADWPGFLGPKRDGASAETGLVAAWKAAAPRELWRRAPGAGYSSMAVTGGAVYTMADQDGAAWVLAYDAATGLDRWSTRVGQAYLDKMNYHGPRATPSVVDGAVYALTGTGVLAALDAATGATRWTVDLVATYGGDQPQWGYSGSPLVSGGFVYLSVGGKAERGVVALNASTGALAWSSGSFGAAYSSPIRATLGGVDQVVFFTAAGPVGVTPDKGALLWKHPWNTSYDVNAATPLVLPGSRLFVASGYGSGGALLQIGAAAASEVWRTKSMKNKLSTSVLVGSHLYGFDEDRLSCVDTATGQQTWNATGYGRGTLLSVDGHLVVLGEDCRASLVAADPKAHRVVAGPHTWLASGPCWTAPALADGVLYLRDAKHLVAVGAKP